MIVRLGLKNLTEKLSSFSPYTITSTPKPLSSSNLKLGTMTPQEERLQKLIKRAEADEDILAVIVYGSYARGEPFRDIDICIVLFPHSEDKSSEKRLEYSDYEDIDVHVFKELPLYIRQRVLKDGKVVHCKNEDLLYDIAIKTVKEYEDFKPRYRMYLEGVLNG